MEDRHADEKGSPKLGLLKRVTGTYLILIVKSTRLERLFGYSERLRCGSESPQVRYVGGTVRCSFMYYVRYIREVPNPRGPHAP